MPEEEVLIENNVHYEMYITKEETQTISMQYIHKRRLSLSEAVQELCKGRVILLQGSLFEPYNVLCQAAQHVNEEFIEMATRLGSDNLRGAFAGEHLEALHILPPLVDNASSGTNSEITVTVKPREGCASQARPSADEYIRIIRALVDPRTHAEDIEYSGRITVQRAHPGGTLKRLGYNEAAVDLMRIAGLEPGAVIGQLSSLEDAEQQHLEHRSGTELLAGMLSVDEIARYRREHRVSCISQTRLPTSEALFHLHHYQEIETGQPYLALILGDIHTPQQQPLLLRIHSACVTGDIFGSQRCDCQAQLHAALHAIAQEGRGMLLYLPQEGRGIGLSAKLQAYALQEQGYDTIEANEQLGYPADARTFSSAIEILHEMGLRHVRLLTNNPQKIKELEESGITVKRMALEIPSTENNAFYLLTKRKRFGHMLTIQEQ